MSPLETPIPMQSPDSVPQTRAKGWGDLGASFWIGSTWIVVLVLLAILAPWLPFIQDPLDISTQVQAAPSPEHLMGTDSIGRDIFARVIAGSRVSLSIGLTSVTLALIAGAALGLCAGYYRGRIDTAIVGVLDVMLAFPSLVLALALVAFAGRSVPILTFVLAFVSIPAFARLARVSTMSLRERHFISAARVMGARTLRILATEILPNLMPSLVAYSLVRIAIVIVAEGSLSFLGLGVAPPTPSWGNIINEGRNLLASAPHISMFPGIVMFLTVLSFNMVGDRLRVRFDTRESKI